MNYAKMYDRLIASRRENPDTGYVEKHHVLPRSLGGGNEPENLVSLSPRAHFVAHRLLAKIHGSGMWIALRYMARGKTNSAKGVHVSSHTFALARKKAAAVHSKLMKGKLIGSAHPMYGKTGSLSPHFDPTEYQFSHPEHGTRNCTKWDLEHEFNLNQGHLSSLVHGKRQVHKGWTCSNPRKN